MLKPVKPRGDTSVAFLSTGLYIKEPAKPRNTPLVPLHINMQGSELSRSMIPSDVFNLLCWYTACLCKGNG